MLMALLRGGFRSLRPAFSLVSPWSEAQQYRNEDNKLLLSGLALKGHLSN